jgi:TolB-like protein/Tfp pilus assembly protein PilF
VIEFGPFALDPKKKVLTCRGEFLPVPPKELELLVFLAGQAGEVFDKAEIMEHVWPGTFVEEGNLARHISFLRQRLAHHSDGTMFIETVPKRGYRFSAQSAHRAARLQAGQRRTTLVVLPFANLSSDPAQEYFTDGFTEEMITRISRWDPDRLRVIARTSAMSYKHTSKSIASIGKELSATHALEGSVRRHGDRLRITAQLIRIKDQSHLWAETYDRRLRDVLKLQDELATAIAEQIKRQFRPALPGGSHRPAESQGFSVAHDLFLRGREAFHQRTEEGMRRCIELCQQAVALDPSFALGYCGIADAHAMLALRGMALPKDVLPLARTAIRRARALAPELGEAFCSLAFVRLLDWDWDRLEEDFLRAIELNPSQAIVYCWYGKYLTAVGRLQQGIAMSEKARLLDPFAPQIAAAVGWAEYLSRQQKDAVRTLLRTIDQQPKHFLPRLKLCMVYVQIGRRREALVQVRNSARLADNSTESLAALAMVHVARGEHQTAKPIIQDLLQRRESRCVLAYNIARIHAAARDASQTLRWLTTACEEKDPDMIELGCDPLFDFVRSEPRFSRLLSRVWREHPSPAGAAVAKG